MGNTTTISNEELEYYCNVFVLCAGGTINMSGNTECKPGDGVGKALQKLESKIGKMGIEYSFTSIFDRPPDSSNVGENEWSVIVNSIEEIIIEKERIEKKLLNCGIKREVGGVVVAHGTDTLHITSLVVALEFAIKHLTVPVVFTASYATIETPKSDAANNLLKSIYCAKERFNRKENLEPGVYVLIGEDIHLASRITKVSTLPNDDNKYFYSFPSPIGQITEKRGTVHFKIDMSYAAGLTVGIQDVCDFDLENRKPWGIVEHIYMDSLAPKSILEDFERRIHFYRSNEEYNERSIGVVLQGDFTRNANLQELALVIKKICSEKVVVLLGSKRSYDKVKDMVGSNYLGLIPKSLSHMKARIKLAWLLRSEFSPESIINLMETNIAGEVFQTDILPEWIRFESFKNYLGYTDVVIAYPNIHSKVIEDAIKRLLSVDNHRRELYLYGFGDGHFPAVNNSIATLVKQFVYKHWKQTLELDEKASLHKVIETLNCYVGNHMEQLSAYFIDRFDALEEKDFIAKIKAQVISKLIQEKRRELLQNVTSFFVTFASKDCTISIPDERLSTIMSSVVNELEIIPADAEIDGRIKGIVCEIASNESQTLRVFRTLAMHYPDPISMRIMKDSIMEASENMRWIGYAVDKGIKVISKTIAVKSKSNIARYEIGNMLLVLGVDSDLARGYRFEFFRPKRDLF